MQNNRVIGYVRVSTEEQADEGVSLAAQEARIRSYCAAMELELVRIEADGGCSASNLERPALRRALASLGKDADGIVVVKLDRLTRSVADFGELLERYFHKKYALMSLAETVDTRSAFGRFLLHVLVIMSQWEREANAERTAVAMQHMKSEGQFTGTVPYGKQLASDGVTLVPCEAEVVLLARVKAMRASGLTLRAIAGALHDEGVYSRKGKRFGAEQIKRMLVAAGA